MMTHTRAIPTLINRLEEWFQRAVKTKRSKPALQKTTAGGEVAFEVSDQAIVVRYESSNQSLEIARIGRVALEQGENGSAREAIRRSGLPTDAAIILPPENVLRKLISLPGGAASKLRDLLKYDIERHSPIAPALIYFDYTIALQDKDASKINVELRIIRRTVIDGAIGFCRNLGLEPVVVRIPGDQAPFAPRSLPLNRTALFRAGWRRWSTAILSTLAFVLVIATLTAVIERRELAAADLVNRVQEARLKSGIVTKLREEIEKQDQRINFLAEQKQQPLLAEILTQLTRTIPDETWIYQFQLNGKEVRIRGVSPSASSLLSLVESSNFFRKAQLRAPLTQTLKPGLERFDLSFEINGPAR